MPYNGKAFTGWADGSDDNPRLVLVTGNASYTAYFAPATLEPEHDTIYVDNWLHDTTYINVHDTTYITLTDTVTNTICDTITNMVYDTVDNYIYDTTVVYSNDTPWLHDTVFVHETVFIYDTIYVGIDEAETISAKIYSNSGQIIVDGAQGNIVWLYDVNGRVLATKQDEYTPLHFDVSVSGVYLVKIGNHPARKVVVVR